MSGISANSGMVSVIGTDTENRAGVPRERRRINRYAQPGLRLSTTFAALASCFLSSCSFGTDKQVDVQRGDPALTRESWQKCSQVSQSHAEDLRSIWFADLRPGAVAAVFQQTATRLRDVSTNNVDRRVIDHQNTAVACFQAIGSVIERLGSAALRDEYVPAGGFLGIVGAARTPTGAGAEINRVIDENRRKLETSEQETIKHVREVYRIELRPW